MHFCFLIVLSTAVYCLLHYCHNKALSRLHLKSCTSNHIVFHDVQRSISRQSRAAEVHTRTKTKAGRSGCPRHILALKFWTVTIPRPPCSDWRDARILVMLLIYPSWQGYSSSAHSISKFMMSANFVSNSANLSSLSKLCQQFSKSVV
jgi:hypothetical protein